MWMCGGRVLWIVRNSDMPMKNKISIIVPVYNRERYLAACLESVRGQTYSNWECLVIDDGSTDDSLRIASSYAGSDSRFKVYRQENNGSSSARNNGLLRAAGEWVLFLDSDDALENEAIECRVKAVMGLGDLAGLMCAIYGPEKFCGNNLNTLFFIRHYRDDLSKEDLLMSLLKRNVFAINTLLISKSAMLREGGFDESLDRAEDWDMWLRLAVSGVRFIFAGAGSCCGAAIQRAHDGGLSSNKLLMIEAEIKVRKKIKNVLPCGAARHQKENNARALHRAMRVAIYDFFSGNYSGSRSRVVDIVRQKGVSWMVYSLIGNLFGIIAKGELSLIKSVG